MDGVERTIRMAYNVGHGIVLAGDFNAKSTA